MAEIDLSSVDADTLARAVANLEVARVDDTKVNVNIPIPMIHQKSMPTKFQTTMAFCIKTLGYF